MTFPVLPANGPSGYNLTNSLRFRASANAYLNRTPASASNRKTWTWSAWVKRGQLGTADALFATRGNVTDAEYFRLAFGVNNPDTIFVSSFNSTTIGLETTASFRDPSSWYHIVFAFDTTQATASNRMKLYVNGVQQTAFGIANYPSQNFDAGVNAAIDHAIGKIPLTSGVDFDGYMAEVNFIDGQALTPSSFGSTNAITGVWQPARYTGTYGTNGFYLPFTNTTSTLLSNSSNISAPFGGVATNALVADGVFCTSNTSTGSSFSFLLNDFGVATPCTRYNIVSLSFTGGVSTFYIQGSSDNSSWSAPLASLSVTGTAQNFSGSLAGNYRYWRLAPVAFGTNGQAIVDQYVLFQEGIGNDFSGNGNNWTTNNISLTPGVTYDAMTDVPTLTSATAANYAVLNPLSIYVVNPTDGNLAFSGTSAGGIGSMGATSGKYYWETVYTAIGSGDGVIVGVRSAESIATGAAENVGYYGGGTQSGQKIINGGAGTAYGATWTTGDVIGVALDITGGSITFYKNNVSQGAISYTFTGKSWVSFNWRTGSAGTNTGSINFGQRPFAYTPPSGFVALNTFNLPSSTIPNGAAYMAATLYTGTSASQAISNAVGSTSFQPDFVWYKDRSNARDHGLFDSVRGVTNYLASNLTNAEQTVSGVTAFDAAGFTLGGSVNSNNSGETYVGWQWKANGAGVTNTAGSITSTVSANTTSGFSVVTYTGTGSAATVGHGLNVAPAMIIVKNRVDGAASWMVYHASVTVGATPAKDCYLVLNATSAAGAANLWNSVAPTSSTFSVSNNFQSNGSSQGMAAYCFAPIAGFSAFGSYTGNGSTDGPFVYLGFRPRFVMVKNTTNNGNWLVWDSSRSAYNAANIYLLPNTNAIDQTSGADIDILSNGFKIKNTTTSGNGSGDTLIYAAFAENPFRNALAR